MHGLCPFTGKVCHDIDAARTARAKMQRAARTNVEAKLIMVYVCPFHETHPARHGKYHVGHAPFHMRKSTKRRRQRYSR